jgi:tripartite-type tricarboxylate transporter receptor subunit TctC
MRLKLQCLFALVLFAVPLGFLTAAVTPAAAPAQTAWPTRPVKLIVPLGPGAGSDIAARLFADRLSKKWGQPVVVENRPGGDALVAINALLTAHDDHVLLFSPASSFTAHPYLHPDLPYKPSDLVPIVQVSNTIIVIAVPADLQVASLKDLVALVRSEPGKLNWAGVTGANDFTFAGWLKSENLNMTKVPYRNPVDAAKDLAAGRVQGYEAAMAIVQPEIAAGKVKLLAVTSTSRGPTVPNVPTVVEAGYPLLQFDGLVGLFGPPGMPLDLRRRIASDFGAVADATIKDRLNTTGQILNIGGPEEFAKSIDEQRAKIAAFAKALGIKPMQ